MVGHLWAGNIFGTNTGKVFLELTGEDAALTGVVRVNDDKFGPIVFDVTGSSTGSVISLSGGVQGAGGQPPVITLVGGPTPQGELKGKWTSSTGTGGLFHLFPHSQATSSTNLPGAAPDQIHASTRQLGALRIHHTDLEPLINAVRADFGDASVIVTYRTQGREKTLFDSAFSRDWAGLRKIDYLKLYVQVPDVNNLMKFAVVELNANGTNDVRVQGVQESWVMGKAESLASHLHAYRTPWYGGLRRHGLRLNAVILALTVALIPDLPLVRRILFIVLAWGIVQAIAALHRRLIPNLIIDLTGEPRGGIPQFWPAILSLIIATAAAVFGAVAYGLLKGELTHATPFGAWLGLIGM